jgi:hypothetical protein
MKTNRLELLFNPKGIGSFSPGLRGTSYPGNNAGGIINPNGVASIAPRCCHNPVGVENYFASTTQGSSCLATLGFVTESRWDANQKRDSVSEVITKHQ